MTDSNPEQGGKSKVLLDADQIGRTLARMTHEIAEQSPNLAGLALVGIQRGGVNYTRLAGLFIVLWH